MVIDNGGSVFPQQVGEAALADGGLTLRDWFATFAPEATGTSVQVCADHDRLANPHGDNYKPRRRSSVEIRADLRYVYADAMIAARNVR